MKKSCQKSGQRVLMLSFSTENSGHRIKTSLKVFKCRNGNVVTNEPDRKLVRIKFELAQITRTGWFQTVWNICESKSSKMLKWSNQFQHVPISGQNRRSMHFFFDPKVWKFFNETSNFKGVPWSQELSPKLMQNPSKNLVFRHQQNPKSWITTRYITGP